MSKGKFEPGLPVDPSLEIKETVDHLCKRLPEGDVKKLFVTVHDTYRNLEIIEEDGEIPQSLVPHFCDAMLTLAPPEPEVHVEPDFGGMTNFVERAFGSKDARIRVRGWPDQGEGRKRVEDYGTVAELAPKLHKWQHEGLGIHVFLNEVDPRLPVKNGSRTVFANDRNIVAIRFVWADFDQGLPLTWELDPYFVVETSIVDEVQRGQAAWKVEPGEVLVPEFKVMQAFIARHFHSDEAVVNPCRTMRLPGSWHLKREPSLVTYSVPL